MLGDNIRRIRLDRHLSQAAFGDILHVSQGAVSQWEQGITRPDTDQLLTISSAFGISLDQLMQSEPIPSFREFSAFPQEPPLTPEEEKLIQDYRHLNSTGKERVRMFIKDYLLIYGT